MTDPPSGTVTFLFTDIEGSTKLAQKHPDRWETLRERHHSILHSAMDAHNGYVFQIIGDAFCVAFHTASDGLNGAIEAQRKLRLEDWGEALIKVRMGIHTGEAELRESDYRGYLTLARVQRVMSAAHGGQVLLSNITAELVRNQRPDGVTLRDMKENRLKGWSTTEHLWQVVAAGLQQEFPPLSTLNSTPNNLPVQMTSFIGRERELGELKELMAKARLVTLTGVGGTGKTRLALQVGADAVDDFEDGVWLVELAPLADPSLVAQVVVSTLGLREQAGRDFLDILKDYLSRKNLLLVLDNCEHLIEACAQLVDALLHAAPDLKILATSREALGIAGESTYPVRSLSLPDTPQQSPDILSQYDAVRLFIDRAVSVQPNFQVTNQNAPAVAQVCARLDGIPLAIELAAARVKGLNVEQIASRLTDRFRLLTGGSRTALPRQRTLQATIDWSYKLLSEEERMLLRQLSVFARGWTLEAVEQVCVSDGIESDHVLDLLLRLVDKSLVIAETQEAEPRYHMLETIRQYAQEKLDEASESSLARDRHLAFFRALAEQVKPHLISSQQLVWLDRLETEHDNVRAALTWAQDSGAIVAGLHLATDLRIFWLYRAHLLEPCLALENLLARPFPTDQIQVLAKAHNVAGILELILGNYAAGYNHAQQSERLCLELGPAGKADLAEARNLLIARDVNLVKDPIRARQRYEENFKLFQEAGDQWGIANALVSIGIQLGRSGDFMGARQAHEQSLALFRACGDNFRVGQQKELLAGIAFHEGKYTEARTSLEAVLSFYRQVRWNLRIDLLQKSD